MLIDIFSLNFFKKVKGILHIGAHECEERTKYLSKFNYISDNEIIWIDALDEKVNLIKQKYPFIKIFNECISNVDNEIITFNVTNNYQSSSILKLKEHLIEHPDIHEINSIQMKTKTLKTFYQENNFNYDQFNFFALDIQGAELLALKGADKILNNIDYIYIEVNTKELYENCALLDDIDKYLSELNFTRENILMTEHGWGDAFYVKNCFNISENFKVYYGTNLIKIDITNTLLDSNTNIIYIPSGDENRAKLYGDPIFGELKYIFIESNDHLYTFDQNNKLYLNLNKNLLTINYIPETDKYELSVMAIFKNETMNLKLWLDHYLWQGVEHFYLIDNDSNDNPLEILQDYIDKGIVSYFFRPEKYKQVEHYRDIFDSENLKEKTIWLCICDLDEFFFGTEKPLINTINNDFKDYNVINTNSFFYGCDDNIIHPKDIRISNIHRNNDTINGNKYIFKPKIINDSSEIWIHWLVIPNTLEKKNYTNEITNNTKIRLNHYQIQSLEYYQKIKMSRGDVCRQNMDNIRTMTLFDTYKSQCTIKDDILKNIIENNVYDKNGIEMKFYDENGKIIDNKSIEFPEQILVQKYILENDIVLELGARYGTVSCSINKKLNNKSSQISVEPDKRVWDALELNKIKNNCNFITIKGFISKKRLGLTNLSSGLGAYGSTFIEDDTSIISSFSLDEIKSKYNIKKFTALVADCEGFLEIFFDENPELYEELRFIMFEADYPDKCNYDKIIQNLILHKFVKILEGHQNIWIRKEAYQLSNNVKIKYGIYENSIDVTNIVYNNYNNNSIIFIPDGDGKRATTLGDPLSGIIKSIFIYDNEFIYNENINNIDNIKVFIYGDSHGRYNFNKFLSNEKIKIYNKQQDNITMHRIARDKLIINFDNNEHDNNSILCFNYGEIDCRCHIQKQINLGRNENEVINDLIDNYFQSIKKNIKLYKKIVIIAIIPATYKYDYEKNHGPVTHKHPFVGSDQDRIRYTYKMNKTIKKYCDIYNFIYFDPFSYYMREDLSLDNQYYDGMVHLSDNNYFLDKFYSNILFDKKYDVYKILHYQEACIDLNKNELYIAEIPDVYKMDFKLECESMHLKYYDNITNYNPNFSINSTENNLYKFENVVNYEYQFCKPEIIIKYRKNKYILNNDNKSYYLVMDCPGFDAFAHWIYECFIFCEIFQEIILMYPNIKILTSNKKKYVRNFLDFVGINNEIIYDIKDYNNICIFPPLICLNTIQNTAESYSFNMFKTYINKLLYVIENKTHIYNFQNNLVYLPRNSKDNFYPVEKISEEFLFERRNQEEINYISKGVLNNGGVILETYNINNINIQFSIIRNSKNIILDYGSSFYVNSLFLKNKNIIVLNPININHNEIPSIKYIFELCLQNNNTITILNKFSSYNDIELYLR